MTNITIFRATAVSFTIKDCSHRPSSGPMSIPCSVVSKSASRPGGMLVLPLMSPAALFTTLCATSNTPNTMLNVLDRIVTATKVLKNHLKNIHVSISCILFLSIIRLMSS